MRLKLVFAVLAILTVSTSGVAQADAGVAEHSAEDSVSYNVGWKDESFQVHVAGKKTHVPNPCTYTKTVVPPGGVNVALWAIDEANKRNLNADITSDMSLVMKDKTSNDVQLTSYTRSCPGRGEDLVWLGEGSNDAGNIPILTHEMIAEYARRSLTIPTSTVNISPDPWKDNNRPPLVNMPISWWADAAPITGPRATAGPMWVEVTATPRSTSWTTSDSDTTRCSTLGKAWAPYMTIRNPALCNVTYTKSHDPETAEISVTWDLTWQGNGGRTGTLSPITVVQNFTLPVCQRQILIVANNEPRPPEQHLIPGTCHE